MSDGSGTAPTPDRGAQVFECPVSGTITSAPYQDWLAQRGRTYCLGCGNRVEFEAGNFQGYVRLARHFTDGSKVAEDAFRLRRGVSS